MLRIGQGFDVHKFAENRKLVLCGEVFDYPLGLLGHSDADVAVHAVMDAVLGALALGDIGKLFPDHDPAFLNADSMELLARVLAHPEVRAWSLQNLDVTIVCEAPKIAPHTGAMREKLAHAFCCGIDRISVKGTTTEKLGFTGRGEGIAASAVLLLASE